MLTKEGEKAIQKEIQEIEQEIDNLMDKVLKLKEREYKIKCELYL